MESITKEITFIEDDRLSSSRYYSNGHSSDYYSLKMFKPPLENYSVTYRLDSEGPFRVFEVGGHAGVRFQIEGSDRTWAPICFLPPEWDGKRVSRTVTLEGGD